MWVASTTGGVSNQTPVSLGSSPALGVLRESPSWLPNLFGTKRQNHSSTALKTGLRLVCSMRAKNLPLRIWQKTGSDNEDTPHEGRRQNRSAVYQTPVSFG